MMMAALGSNTRPVTAATSPCAETEVLMPSKHSIAHTKTHTTLAFFMNSSPHFLNVRYPLLPIHIGCAAMLCTNLPKNTASGAPDAANFVGKLIGSGKTVRKLGTVTMDDSPVRSKTPRGAVY